MRTMRMTARAVLLSIGLAAPALSADGELTIDLLANSKDMGRKVDVSAGGRIYVGAYRSTPPTQNDPGYHAEILAFDSQGVPIQTFGTNGRVVDAGAESLSALADDSVVTSDSLELWHLDANGSVRLRVDTDAYAVVAAQADGKYVIFGYRRNGLAFPDYWDMLRYTTGGSLDATFAGGSVRRTSVPFSPGYSDLLILPDGRLLGTGTMRSNSPVPELRITEWLVDPQGVPGPGFPFNGLTYQSSCSCRAEPGRVAFDSAANQFYVSGTDRIVSRVDMTGQVDTTFPVLTNDPDQYLGRIFVDALSRLLVTGSVGSDEAPEGAFVSRYLPTGELDATYGVQGTARVRVGSSPQASRLASSALQADGKLLLLFTATPVADVPPGPIQDPDVTTDLALKRLNVDGSPDTHFAEGVASSDAYPDPIVFTPLSVPYGARNLRSEVVTITGINQFADAKIVEGPGHFDSTCTSVSVFEVDHHIADNKPLCIRSDAPTGPGESVSTTIEVGGRRATFTITSSNEAVDTTPDEFTFTAQPNAAISSTLQSNTITISGLTGPANIGIHNGKYSVGCMPGGFLDGEGGIISNGETICVQHGTPGRYSTDTITTLTIGGVNGQFKSVTQAEPAQPPKSKGGGAVGLEVALLLLLVLARVRTPAAISLTASRTRRPPQRKCG